MAVRNQASPAYGATAYHLKALLAVFCAWKSLLLAVACASPGPGYDTSTQLLLRSYPKGGTLATRFLVYMSSKLVRWDAVYYIRVAQRDYLFEQEWAFGWGFTRVVSFVAKGVLGSTMSHELRLKAKHPSSTPWT